MTRRLAEGDLDFPLHVSEDGVTEIVVHGVGGSTPAAMLEDISVRQITGDQTAGIWRGQDGVADGTPWHREAYSWGGLTSRAFITALWLLLAPFSLINLAGWMALGGAPDRAGRPDWRIAFQQALVRVLALATTLTYVLFVAQIAMDLGAWQCTQIDRCRIQDWARGLSPHLSEQPARVVVVAALLPLMFVLALHFLAGRTRSSYENYQPTGAAASLQDRSQLDSVPVDLPAMSLSDPHFWTGRMYAVRSRWLHALASVILVAALLLAVVDRRAAGPIMIDILRYAVAASLVILAMAAGWQWARRKLLGGVKRLSAVVVIAAALLVVSAVLAWTRPAPIRQGRPGMMPGVLEAFNILLIAVFVVVLFHAAIALTVRYGRNRKLLGAVPKVPGPAIVVTVGIWLMFAIWAGAVVWVARWLSPAAVAGQTASSQRLIYPIPYRALAQFSLLGAVLVVVVVGVYVGKLALTRHPDLEPEEEHWLHIRQGGLVAASSRWAKRVRRSKFTADAADWIEVGLSTLAILATVVPVAYSLWFGVEWLGGTAVLALTGAAVCLGLGLTAIASASWRNRAALGVVAFLAAAALSAVLIAPQIHLLSKPQPSGPGIDRFLLSDGVTSTILTAIPVLTILLIRRALKSPETRRHVGTAWDVATFWPRPFHPIAPPPYAERAIPELGNRVGHLLGGDHAVLLEGHSQGAVITIATLAQLRRQLPPEQLGRLSVITYGNPLRRLYRRWFPEYTRQLIDDLGIGDPACTDDTNCHRHVNFHRYTDPIGRDLFARADPRERWLPDPPINGHRLGDGEPLIRGHSHAGYVKEHGFREYRRDEIKRLAGHTHSEAPPESEEGTRIRET